LAESEASLAKKMQKLAEIHRKLVEIPISLAEFRLELAESSRRKSQIFKGVEASSGIIVKKVH